MTPIKHNNKNMTHSFLQRGQASRQNRGQAVIIAIIFFLVGSLIIVTGISAPVLREISEVRTLMESKQSFFTAESGVEDVYYRFKYDVSVSDLETITFATSTVTVTTNVTLEEVEIVAVGDKNDKIRTVRANLIEEVGVSFFYGVQSDAGGIQMANSSKILGNAYSNGPIIGSGSNLIQGDAISTGPIGLVKEVLVEENVWAHNIEGATIKGDAFFGCPTCLSPSSTVVGTRTDNSPDQPSGGMPIPDDWIDSWEQDAEDGGVIKNGFDECATGTYNINSDTVLGPVKIECDLVLKGAGGGPEPILLTLAGNVWVVGDIDFTNKINVTVADSLGEKSVVMIANNDTDLPTSRKTSSKIEIQNSFFAYHPVSGSHMLLISRNSSSKNGGSEIAINVQQTAYGDFIVYSNEGEVHLQNSISLSEVSAYKISIQNTAQIIYETGLRNLLFDSGPSGGYVVDGWGEI